MSYTSALTPTSIIPVPIASKNGSETSKTTYLDRSVSLIDLKTASNHDFKKTLWTIASYVSIIAFAALAVSAFVAVGIFAPVYLPLAAIATFISLQPAYRIFSRLKNIAEHEGRLAQQTRDFADEHKKLPTDTTAISAKLATMGIARHQLKGDLQKLTPLIAQYEYWTKEIGKQTHQAKELSKAADAVAKKDPDNIEEIKELRLAAIEYQENALTAKIHAAFIHAVIRNPQFTGEMSDFCSIKQISFEERALAARFKDPKADEFLVFKKDGVTPVTMSQIQDNKTMPIHKLAQRMSAAMA